MALNFPNNPSVGDVYEDSASGFSYQWDGTFWKSYKVDISDSLGGNLDADLILNSNDISGTGNINITGVVTATSFDGGTATFSSDVDIGTGGTTAFFDVSTGRVGVGTISPGRTLDVNGVIRSDGTSGGLAFGGNSSTPSEGAAIYRPANSTLAFVTDSSERMRLDSAGNVGIGTISPATDISGSAQGLSVAHSNVAFLSIENTAASGKRYTLYANDSGSLVTYDEDANAARMLIDSSGNLGLGTVSPSRKLHVASSFIRVDDGYGLDSSGSTEKVVLDNGFISLTTNSSEQMRLDSSGRLGLGTASPGALVHLKNNSPFIRFTDSVDDTHYAHIGYSDSSIFVIDADAGNAKTGSAIQFKVDNAEAMRLDSSGQLGVGETIPDEKVHIKTSATNSRIKIENTSTGQAGLVLLNSTKRFDFQVNGDALQFYDSTSATERMRIDSSGRLLVGRTSIPTSADATNSKLTLSDASGANLIIVRDDITIDSGDFLGGIEWHGNDNGDSYWNEVASIYAAADAQHFSTQTPTRLVFSTCGTNLTNTEQMRIDSSGSSFNRGDLDSHTSVSGASAGTSYFLYRGRRGSTILGSTTAFIVWSNGDVQNTNNSYTAISDAKLKENIVDATSQWDDLKSIQIRKYNFKEETGHQTHTQLGVVAQEVELVSPGLVTESPDRDEEGNDLGTTTKSVNYSVLYIKAIKALQEAMDRIETLESEVAALKNG